MPNQQIRADIFPAILTLTNPEGDSQVLDKVRIILTLDHVYVFQDSQPKPAIVFEDRLTSYTPPVPSTRVRKASQLLDNTAKFATEDGSEGSFLRTGGCGCGSRLKKALISSLLPDGGVPQAASTADSL